HVLGADEALFDVGFRHALDGVAELGGHQLGGVVGFRHALDGVAELGGHQLGGVVVDDVVDLQHHALTHQELDDLNAAHGHPVGELAHGDDVGDDHFTGHAGLLLDTALALFTLTLAGAADGGERAHPLGALGVAGHGL